jgi:hypothetical protein
VAKFFQIFGKDSNKSKFDSGEVKRRMNLSNACYHSSRTLVFSSAVKNIKTRIYKTIILPVVLYACETWFVTLRE